MRIALFTETFLPRIDGVVTTLCYLLEHIRKRQHEAILFSPITDQSIYAGTPVVSYAGFPFPLYPEFTVTPPNTAIRSHLLHFQPDLIHTLSPVSLGLAGLWYGRRLQIPVVASYHTDVAGYAGYYGLGFLRSPLWTALRLIHNQADLNLCPSSITQRQLEGQGFHRVRIWTRGVDTIRFSPDKYSFEWRWRLSNGQPEKPLLIYVGRLSAEKRIDWLRDVLVNIPGLRLVIVGDGPDRMRLEGLFAGLPVVFTGYLRGEKLAQAYASADLFVFPAANETLGNVVLEAMASGLAVVTTNAGGPSELVHHDTNGLLFSSKSQAELLKAIQRLLAEPDLIKRLRMAARMEALSRSWEVVFDDLLEDYVTVVNHKRLQARRKSDSSFIRQGRITRQHPTSLRNYRA